MENGIPTDWNLDWLKASSVRLVWNTLTANGAKVFFVGGCVRDTVQRRKIKDIDIATDALPAQVMQLSKTAGLKVIQTGLSHGSVTIISNGDRFEVTTFRSDLISDGRHSEVGFSTNIEEDAKRRDFTMNAVYMTIDAEIIDPIFGWEDLVNGHVRFIGNPEERIQEDYLRILRYFRFLTIFGHEKSQRDSAALDACSKAAPGLKQLSNERVWEELQKILSSHSPIFVLKAMESCGVLEEILPSSNIKSLERFLTAEDQLCPNFKVINRLAALNIYQVGSWIKKLSLTKEQNRWIGKILVFIKDTSSLRVKGYKYKEILAWSAFVVFLANSNGTVKRKDLAEIKFGSAQRFPLETSDFLKFFSPSKELGNEINRITKFWFDSDLEMGRKDLLAELQNPRQKNIKPLIE